MPNRAAALADEGTIRASTDDSSDYRTYRADSSIESMRGVFRIHDATRFDGILLHEALWRSIVAAPWWGEGCVGTLTAL